MDPQLRRQLRNVVTIGIPGTLDVAGIPIFTSATVPCRIEADTREIPLGRSEIEGRSRHRVYIAAQDFNYTDRQASALQFQLPGEPDYRKAYQVITMYDERGARDYVEVVI
jgi:hypothetical protein